MCDLLWKRYMWQLRHHHWNLFVLYNKELNIFDDDINCVCPSEEQIKMHAL